MTEQRPFHSNASPNIFDFANILKKAMTTAETALWEELRNRRLNSLKFRRQHPTGQFILDFYCYDMKLAIEVDGSIHNSADVMERDSGRTYMLAEWDITVMRFTNEEILKNIKLVRETIKSFKK